MGPSPTVRAAHLDDSQQMQLCSMQVLPHETQPINYTERLLSTYPGLSHVAVNDKDEIVGICLATINEGIKDATHAHVCSLLVLPEYQGQGVGRRLLETCLQSARTSFNASQVTLHVRKSNERALGLYTSLKFYTTKTEPGFYYDGEDGFFMNLVLGNDVDN